MVTQFTLCYTKSIRYREYPVKPKKITTNSKELFTIIENKIAQGMCIFTDHAKQRGTQRGITDEEVLNILENKKGYTRRWIQVKDTFEAYYIDEPPTWRYCIEGTTLDKEEVRIILTFTDDWMPIITVIKL